MKSPLGRDRMLCRGEFGAAVFEKRHSIRSRRAGKAFFGIARWYQQLPHLMIKWRLYPLFV